MKAAGQAVIDHLANDGIERHWQDVYAEGFKAMYDAAPEIQQEPVGYVREIRPGEWKFSKTTSWGPDVWPPVYQLPPDAQEEIDKLDARIKELAAQNQQLREQLQMILDADYRKWEDLASPDEFVRWAKSRANYMLQLPDIASKHMNRVKAEAYREIADFITVIRDDWAHVGDNHKALGADYLASSIRNMADAIEKGEKV